MTDEQDVQLEIEKTKSSTARGCLFWIGILLGIPLFLIAAFVYSVAYKETEIEKGFSPDGKNMVKVVQKGEGLLHSPIRVYYGPHYKLRKNYETAIVKGSAKQANVSIEWNGNDTATVTIYGASPETLTVSISE